MSAAGLHHEAILLAQAGRAHESVDMLRRAVSLAPREAVVRDHLARALRFVGRLDESLTQWRIALELRPKCAEALAAMGDALFEMGRLDECLTSYRRAVSLRPGNSIFHSRLLYAMHYHPDCDSAAILRAHRKWGRQIEKRFVRRRQPHRNAPDPERRLRIGYVSPAFMDHAVGRFIYPLLAHHNRARFEIHLYSDTTHPDDFTECIRAHADHWRSTRELSAAQLAAQIRADGIDVLVDLSLHAAGNRLLTFARKPAPVQITWLAIPGTSGLAAMDYRLTDSYLDSPSQAASCYSEQSIHLPRCFWCYSPPRQTPMVNALPAETLGFVTFGCLNRFEKVTEPVLRLWRRILRRIAGSRLIIHSREASHLDAVRRGFAEAGVAPERLEFIGNRPLSDYYSHYHRIDIALDPFPHAGATVTCDALWMGVPVITLAGATAVGRAGVSILSNLACPEWIAATQEQYVEIAVNMAANHMRLAQARNGLRGRMETCGMTDGRRFALEMEQALGFAWRRWCGQGGLQSSKEARKPASTNRSIAFEKVS